MGPGVVLYSMFFVLSLLLIPDSSFGEKPPLEAILHNKVRHLLQQDDIPIIQPTTPTGTPNTDSPTTFPPTTTTPTGNPTTLPPPSPTGFQPNNPTPFPTTPTGTTPTAPMGPSNPMGPSVPTAPTGPSGPTGPTGPSGSSSGSWCIASPSASETSLQVALDYACGYGGADCSAIQPGSSCYNPNTVRDHASYAFNAYYQKNPAPTSCSFGGVAQVTNTDPSSGSCRFSAAKSTGMMTPPTPPMPTPPTSPTISSPINPYPTTPTQPGGFSSDQPGYTSSEPTGEPNSAAMMVANLFLPLMITILLVFLNREK
ncbi:PLASMODESMATA CALLOSE-BINDING PROTEIN 3 [Lactuca sativa]|uniref:PLASMODESMATA CALLOSE-BINDING PROTEIN 3 n=1 Tax=Lactuca sativa TaxID=4236 RepID=UPI000CC09260|nr:PLASMODESMATA CALLOSE-BINDING PROTEIN 3 [Lactuca sativa]